MSLNNLLKFSQNVEYNDERSDQRCTADDIVYNVHRSVCKLGIHSIRVGFLQEVQLSLLKSTSPTQLML